jgi:hypothetical protein
VETYAWGPDLVQQVRADISHAGIYGSAEYRYVAVASVSNWKDGRARPRKVPAYRADYIEISAYQANMSAPLEPLRDMLAARPGHVAAMLVREHPTLRPQVVALFATRA